MIPVLFALGKLFEKSTAYVVCISNKKNPTIAEVNIFLVILNGSSGMYISWKLQLNTNHGQKNGLCGYSIGICNPFTH